MFVYDAYLKILNEGTELSCASKKVQPFTLSSDPQCMKPAKPQQILPAGLYEKLAAREAFARAKKIQRL
jgi:hypothetical protein